ncbi:MAG: tRNA 4-thiouridine(8) synthase ThiI [Anaerolineae bacterium]|nr:tRNA 4-thiouridine(8) synthase ThiI [Anaerolineae bacterium]
MNETASHCAVVHYAEIGLKGRNRPFFERALARNIERRLSHLGVERVERLTGRLMVWLAEPLPQTTWNEMLRTVCGVAHFAPAYVTAADMESLRAAILDHLPGEAVDSFRIRVRRDDKSFPLTSPEVARELGAVVQQRTGWPVQLKGAALEITVEILRKRAILSLDKLPGPGGLPVGASGRAGLLLSGGIDSPVAGYLALKRGCRLLPIHFHSRPFGNWMGAEARAREIVRALQAYGMDPVLYTVGIGRQQREIAVRAPVAMRVILYRRLMVRIAQALTRQKNGKALFTGESLGQVASQTLESLGVIEEAVTIPVLRPLIAMDKKEIVALAREIGTFSISQMEGDDCCQFLMPRRVITRPQLPAVLAADAAVEMERLVEEALEQVKRIAV